MFDIGGLEQPANECQLRTREMCSRINMHTHVAVHTGPSPSQRLKTKPDG